MARRCALTAGQAVAAVAHDGVESLRQRGDQVPDLGGAQDVRHLRLTGLRLGVGEVRADGVVEEVCLLATRPTLERTESRVASRRSVPLMRTVPDVGSYRRATRPVRVVLPAPLGPTRATIWPGSTWKLTSFSTSPPPRRSPLTLVSGRQRHVVCRRVAERRARGPRGPARPGAQWPGASRMRAGGPAPRRPRTTRALS